MASSETDAHDFSRRFLTAQASFGYMPNYMSYESYHKGAETETGQM